MNDHDYIRPEPVGSPPPRPPTTPGPVHNITTVEPRNALGIASLVLGLIGILFALVPLTGFVAVALGITGLILGFANRGRLRRGTATNRKTTLAGLIASLAALIFGVIGIVIVFDAFDQLDQDMEEIEQELDLDSGTVVVIK